MIEIRPVTTLVECRHLIDITCAAWETIPADAPADHVSLIVAKERGGVVLMAWDGEKPVGFCWGFLAFADDGKTLKHASHMLGVLPDYQSQGVGERLKWAQREAALGMGLPLMTWTFDPLWTLNGRLNLRKLGGVSQKYVRNLYGNADDGLNRGLPTDRFYVDWWLGAKPVQARVDGMFKPLTLGAWRDKGAVLLNPASVPDDPKVLETLQIEREMPAFLIAVPKYYPALVQSDPNIALSWRMFTRNLFEFAFKQGYQAVDLICDGEMCYYICIDTNKKDLR